MAYKGFVFRQIDVGRSVSFGFSMVIGCFYYWAFIGIVSALASSTLSGLFWGPKPPFWGRAVLFLTLGLWPIAVAARASFDRLDGKLVGHSALFALNGVASLLLPAALVFVVAGAGGLGMDWALTRAFGKELVPTAAGLDDPLTMMGIMRFYPLMCLGGMTMALTMPFGLFFALDKGLGVSAAMNGAGRLAKDVKMELLFLHAVMFFTSSTSFLLGFLTGVGPFPKNVVSQMVFAAAFGFAGAVWAEAYRQVLTYEEPEAVRKTKQGAVHWVR